MALDRCRLAPLLLTLATLWGGSSCSAPAVLVTDEVHRQGARGLVAAWTASAPWKPAVHQALEGPQAAKAVLRELDTRPPVETLILAVQLSASERRTVWDRRGDRRIVFVGPSSAPGPSLVLDPEALRAGVATAAARATPGAAARAFFPSGASDDERQRFEAAWKASGGGPLQTLVWPDTGTPVPDEQVFNWVGVEAEALVLGLDSTVRVHGDPGTLRAVGAGGYEWALAPEGLAETLWQAVGATDEKPYFLPWETVFVNR